MPDPAPMTTILSKLVRTHKHKVRLLNKYNAVDRACKKVISKLIPEKYYKSISSQIIGFKKVTSLQILTHLITEYAEMEDDDIQEIDQKMKEQISGETIFEEFIEKIEWNKEAVAVQNLYTPAQISLWRTQTSKNAGYIKMIFGNSPENRGLRRPGATSKLTSLERLKKHKYHPGLQIPRGMQPMCNPHKPMRRCSPRCSRTTPWS